MISPSDLWETLKRYHKYTALLASDETIKSRIEFFVPSGVEWVVGNLLIDGYLRVDGKLIVFKTLYVNGTLVVNDTLEIE